MNLCWNLFVLSICPSLVLFSHFFTPFLFPLLYFPFSPFSFIPYFSFSCLLYLAIFKFTDCRTYIPIHSLMHKFTSTLRFFFNSRLRGFKYLPFISVVFTLHFNFHILHFDHHFTFIFFVDPGFPFLSFYWHSWVWPPSILSLFW